MADPRSIDDLVRALVDAQKRSTKASDARAALPAGSSRPRVTTANARWMRAAEDRDRCEAALRAALEAASDDELARRRLLAEDRIARAYWAFTRQARANPPAVAEPGAHVERRMIDEALARRKAVACG